MGIRLYLSWAAGGLLRDPDVLLLGDATSALDAEREVTYMVRAAQGLFWGFLTDKGEGPLMNGRLHGRPRATNRNILNADGVGSTKMHIYRVFFRPNPKTVQTCS